MKIFNKIFFTSLFCIFLCFPSSANSQTVSVLEKGAKGDGVTDDAAAFKLTWDVACKTQGGVMLVPSGYTFLLQPVIFDGTNCQPNAVVKVDGKIIAPMRTAWTTSSGQWIQFSGFSKGLTITGNGVFDGYGMSWWKLTDVRPDAVRIMDSYNVIVTGIKIQNSPRMHLDFFNNQLVQVYNFTVSSPADSPNTDGIHIAQTQHLKIYNTTLAAGDDCVGIQNGTKDVNIYNVICGPGHGFSIGGLGPNKEEAEVSDVTVTDSVVFDSLTGVRIKTWPSGTGFAKNVVFSSIKLTNVGTAIVIDQYYCGALKNCSIPDRNAVAVSNVTFTNIKGTYSFKSVTLECSDFTPCRYLTLGDIDVVPTPEKAKAGAVQAVCRSAYGRVLTATTPSLQGCVSPETPQIAEVQNAPAVAPAGF